MDISIIEQHTREVIPEWRDAALTLSAIEKGGSGRGFFRIEEAVTGRRIVAVSYDRKRPDNERFAPVTAFLNRHDIPAPNLIAWDEPGNIVWVEDLGSLDLSHLEMEDWDKVRRPAYEDTLRTVMLLHSIVEAEPPQDLPELEPAFDESIYQWEQDYFVDQYVARFHSETEAEWLRSDSSLRDLKEELSVLPRSLVHRDFQSTNVMMVGDRSFLIDYQGLRWGVPEYDLGSLLFDPYIDFTSVERRSLADFYYGLKVESGNDQSPELFERQLVRATTQRLMQAMGAFGFLGEVKGKKEFLEYIPAGRDRLIELSQCEGGLAVLGELLGD
jgi:aminoglycoside/choline kinase family phosphotransferase